MDSPAMRKFRQSRVAQETRPVDRMTWALRNVRASEPPPTKKDFVTPDNIYNTPGGGLPTVARPKKTHGPTM